MQTDTSDLGDEGAADQAQAPRGLIVALALIFSRWPPSAGAVDALRRQVFIDAALFAWRSCFDVLKRRRENI